jgi:hypothetical protein
MNQGRLIWMGDLLRRFSKETAARERGEQPSKGAGREQWRRYPHPTVTAWGHGTSDMGNATSDMGNATSDMGNATSDMGAWHMAHGISVE